MIGKQVKGSNFTHLLNYLFSKPGAKLIGGNMIGETTEELTAEFRVSADTNSRVKKPVFHAMLSTPKSEQLTDETWNEIANDYMMAMQFTANSFAVIRHSDRDHDHIHIASSRVRLDERNICVNDSWERPRSEKIIRELEKKYDLTPTESSKWKDRRPPTTKQCRMMQQTGSETVKTQLQDTIDTISSQQPTMPEFIRLLKDRGIDVRVKPTPTGELGISYSHQGIAFSGSHLGKAYTFPGLQKHRGISYTKDKDDPAIAEAINREPGVGSQKPGSEQTESFTPQSTSQGDSRPLEVGSNKATDTTPKVANDSPSKPPEVNTPKTEESVQQLELQQQIELQILRNHLQATTSPEPDRLAEWFARQKKEAESTDASETLDTPFFSDRATDEPPSTYPVEENWQAVQENLVNLQGLPQELLGLLHEQAWLYANDEGEAVFSLRTLEGKDAGAYIFDPQSQTSCSIQDPESPGHFWVATSSKINKVVITSDPVETLCAIAIDPTFRNNDTLYLSLDGLDQATAHFLAETKEVLVGLKAEDSNTGILAALLEQIPHLEQVQLDDKGWNGLLIKANAIANKPVNISEISSKDGWEL